MQGWAGRLADSSNSRQQAAAEAAAAGGGSLPWSCCAYRLSMAALKPFLRLDWHCAEGESKAGTLQGETATLHVLPMRPLAPYRSMLPLQYCMSTI